MNYTEEELNIETEKEIEQPKKSFMQENTELFKTMLACLVLTWLFAILFFIPFIAILNYLGIK